MINSGPLALGNTAYDAYAAGTAYSLTATPAGVVLGTTSPSITILVPGTYRIRGRVLLQNNGATFAANRTITLKFRRTNNTAGDLTNGSMTVLSGIITIITGPGGVVVLPEVVYTTTNADDVITIFGDVSVVPTAGSLDVVGGSIHAVRVA